MKVKTHIISEQDTEEVRLYIRQVTPDLEKLREYIESIQEIQYIHTTNEWYLHYQTASLCIRKNAS